MAKNDLSEEFLVPSLELIKTSMEEVFNYPRYILILSWYLFREIDMK